VTSSTASQDGLSRDGVSVIIAAWRAEETIGRAIASALAQPEATEVVVVEDASQDAGATLAAAHAADDGSGRLKVIALDRNGGPARARNAAIAASKAPWICILDSDDYLEPGRLAALLKDAADGHDFIADDLIQVAAGADRSTGRPMWFVDHPVMRDISLAFFVETNISRASRYRRELGFLKPMMRRSFLDQHGLRYDETMRLGEDYDFYARALAAGARFRLTPAAGYVSVMRNDSLSARHSRSDLAAFEACDQRLLASASLDAEEQRVIRSHAFSTQKRIAWIDFIERLKALHLAGALDIVLRNPRLAPHLAAGLGKIAARRLSGSKDGRQPAP
jgi:succinoglycan biosynthesis protein ExoU